MKPDHDVIIIGGGPAGSTCATFLAREGKNVLVLESERHPRFHIGESITAWGTDLFKDLGVFEDLKKVNTIRKRGLEYVHHTHTRKLFFPDGPGRDEEGCLPWAFQMPRGRLDKALFDNARKRGADCREEQKVRRVLFEGERAVGVEWQDMTQPGAPLCRATARWILDASGQANVLNKQLQGNCADHHLLARKVSIFGHFRGKFDFQNGDHAIHFKLCVHRNLRDWAWWIPIDPDLVSIGVVLSPDTVKNRQGTQEELFRETIDQTAFLSDFMRQDMERVGELHSIVDYSYSSKKHVGDGWALVGDSAGFIDPVFSTGLQITFNSARKLSAAMLEILGGTTPQRQKELLTDYDRTVDRYYRVNGTLVHLFYMAGVDPLRFEDAGFMWKAIPWAGWKYRLKFLYWGLRLAFKDVETRRRMGEEVVFGNPQPGNLVAEQFLMLSKNFDEIYAKEIAQRGARRLVQQEA